MSPVVVERTVADRACYYVACLRCKVAYSVNAFLTPSTREKKNVPVYSSDCRNSVDAHLLTPRRSVDEKFLWIIRFARVSYCCYNLRRGK